MTAIDPRIHERRVEVARREGRRRLAWIGGIAALLAAGGLLLAVLHTPWMSAQVVTVTGQHPNTSTTAIEAAAGLAGHPPLINVDTGAVASRVERLPYVARAAVQREWPDGVRIAVTERVATLQMAGPGSRWSVLDAEGRTLGTVPARIPGLPQLVVYGPPAGLAPPPVGHTLAGPADAALTVARTLPLAFSGQVLAVAGAPDATVSLTLNSGLTVLLGATDSLTAKYEDVAAIIAHASLAGAKTIDVTVPQSPTVS